MKTNLALPSTFRQQMAELAEGPARPKDATAARMIQLARALEVPKGLDHAAALDLQARAIGEALPSSAKPTPEEQTLLREATIAQTVLRTSSKIVAKHTALLEAAAARDARGASGRAPTAEQASAFLAEFHAVGVKGAQQGSHDHWYVTMGPSSGKTFLFTPSAEAIEARALQLANAKGVPVADKHRLSAADELAKEQKVTFGEGEDAPGAAGRIFAAPYDVLTAVGGFALAKADANNAESVKAASMGLLAHLSGKDLSIDQSLDAAGYRMALKDKLGNLEQLNATAPSGRSWSQLSEAERAETTAYFGGMLAELAELELGRRSYEQLSPATTGALRTTHDVYVQMRESWLFDDGWGKSQAVPFDQLSKKLKDADMPPFLFALESMVREAEKETQALRKAG